NTQGVINSIDALEVGFTGIMIGAGRMKVDDVIDPKAGIIFRKKVDDAVSNGDILATIFVDDKTILEAAALRLERAIVIASEPLTSLHLIHAFIDESGVHEWKG
ncbi:MAG: thymidine phosphorylase, partial [Bacteroidetes bacterium]|nr:thymidine phosphorylase [Bacteroidota bacterium]MBU1423025.1 thymidine phosphorylase [Bacteroidota bacterium]